MINGSNFSNSINGKISHFISNNNPIFIRIHVRNKKSKNYSDISNNIIQFDSTLKNGSGRRNNGHLQFDNVIDTRLKKDLLIHKYKRKIKSQFRTMNFNLWKTRLCNKKQDPLQFHFESISSYSKPKACLRQLLEEANSYIFSFNNKNSGLNKREILSFDSLMVKGNKKINHSINYQNHSLSEYDSILSKSRRDVNNCKPIKKIFHVDHLKFMIRERRTNLLNEVKNKHLKRQKIVEHLNTERKIENLKEQFLYNQTNYANFLCNENQDSQTDQNLLERENNLLKTSHFAINTKKESPISSPKLNIIVSDKINI